MRRSRLSTIAFWLVGIWALFTVSLVGWWITFGIRQLDLINRIDSSGTGQLARYHRMLMWEGGVLILCLLGGAAALFYYVLRERSLRHQIQLFFLTFAHELKTPLASLRLQCESLKEDLQHSPHAVLVQRIVSDTSRLALRLENTLLLASLGNQDFHFETFALSEIVHTVRLEWPELKISFSDNCIIEADRRIFEALLKNLVQNSIVHGKASEISIKTEERSPGRMHIWVRDNGSGFKGNVGKIAKPFTRHYSGSGSGIGLYLVKSLMDKMKGGFKFAPCDPGCEVELWLKGHAA